MHLQYIQLYIYTHYFTLFRFTKALCALRRKGITRAGPAAAAQLLSEFSHAVGADLTGLCCVPLDGELSLVPNGDHELCHSSKFDLFQLLSFPSPVFQLQEAHSFSLSIYDSL